MTKSPSYFVVMVDYGSRGREAIVDPEETRRGIIARIASGEYGHINFIHHIDGGLVEDVTDELVDAAEAISNAAREPMVSLADRIQADCDHRHDLRKHEVA